METFDIYQDIATRTGGDIYLGVVGPVRTGKSTFIKRFMETFVLPNIEDVNRRTRVIDELPQSADGKTIMTTQPKFVPDGGVKISFGEGLNMNVRLIDCVGYVVANAEGYKENDSPRYVRTPWSEEEMPFEKAAEIGTRKVICDHSTIGIVMTTDGSIAGLKREDYIESEERVIREMKELRKPFVVIVNSKNPSGAEAKAVCDEIKEKYNVCTLVFSVIDMTKKDMEEVLKSLLTEFPLTKIEVGAPKWMQGLDMGNEIVKTITSILVTATAGMSKMADMEKIADIFSECEYVDKLIDMNADFGKGILSAELKPEEGLFYSVLSSECGVDITDDFTLISYMKALREAESVYSKISGALREVEATGYGVVAPSLEETVLEEPRIVKKGGKYGVKLVAKSSSLHIMKIDVMTEINPIMGSEEQSNEMMNYLRSEAEKPEGIFKTNLFGKSLDTLIEDGLNARIGSMSPDARSKMVKTVGRIVNEGRGGVLCVLI